MSEGEKTGKAAQAERRRQRLAAELRSNLAKRKEQARRRSTDGQGDQGTEKGKSQA
jgi:hypothetical protein